MTNELSNDQKKKLALKYYEEGKLDEAIEALYSVPKDDETRELHRMFRYADEARSIVVLPKKEEENHDKH